jgi:hypothetical protein
MFLYSPLSCWESQKKGSYTIPALTIANSSFQVAEVVRRRKEKEGKEREKRGKEEEIKTKFLIFLFNRESVI